jgi:hypothetical protein
MNSLRLCTFVQCIWFFVCFNTYLLFAQAPAQQSTPPASIVGTVLDGESRAPMSGARVVLLKGDAPLKADAITSSAIAAGAVTDKRGAFTVRVPAFGTYTVLVTSIAYTPYRKVLTISKAETINLGTIQLAAGAVKTDEVEVTERAIRVEVRGDTTEFTANQFKTEKNAAAEDLVRKMPGIEVDAQGTVKAQGENVTRVLVDGKPFFGSDPRNALKNLPAEIIDRVQVIDQMSEQAQFTRFDDGDRTKTLNIVTKPDKRAGQFGKLYAGYGSSTALFESRYTVGGNVNFFNGDRRISVIALSNNINQQNFSIQDILGLFGNNNTSGMGAIMRIVGGGGGFGGGRGGGGFGGSSVSNFLVPQTDGISASHGLGVNYSDTWDKKVDVTASYFINYTDNVSLQNAARSTFITGNTSQLTQQNLDARTRNLNHNFNARFDYTIDSSNSLLFTPQFTMQNSSRSRSAASQTSLENLPLNSSLTDNVTQNFGYNFTSELLYRYKFELEGRTLSASVRPRVNRGVGDANNTAVNTFFSMMLGTRVDSLLQDAPSLDNGVTVGGNLAYTEPLTSQLSLQASYNVNWTKSESDRRVFDFNRTTSEYDRLNINLSNVAASDYTTHRPGVTLRYNLSTGTTLSVGADYQYAHLAVNQSYPQSFAFGRSFNDVLPSATFTMRIGSFRPPGGGFGGGGPMMFMMGGGRPPMGGASPFAGATGPVGNLRVNYRTSTNQPSIRQLQNVLDNSNPLNLYIGNPQLAQEYTHSLNVAYTTFDISSGTSLFGFFGVNVTQNRIANSTLISTRDTSLLGVLGDGALLLGRGAQLTRPVNVDGYWNARGFGGHSFPIEPWTGFKMNASITGGVNYTRDITLINGATNFGDNLSLAPAFNISSNISENLDFSINARTAYTIVRNSIQSANDNNFFVHSLFARVNWIFGDGFLVSADFNYIANVGLKGGFNQSIPLLNAGIGKRFMNNDAELRLSVFDALNLNNSINRNVTAAFIEDTQTNVLQRYLLLTFTYNLRAFASSSGS